jgi:hypothetical protein
MSRSPPLRVCCPRPGRAFHTRFRLASAPEGHRQAADNNSQTHYAKGRRSPLAGLPHIVGRPLQVLFHSPNRGSFRLSLAVLFTIGCRVVFSLVPWSGRIHAEFHVHRITWDALRRLWTSLTRLSRSSAPLSRGLSSPFACHFRVPQPRRNKFLRFRLFRVRSPLLAESLCFLFLGLLRCFTSPRLASPDYEFIRR